MTVPGDDHAGWPLFFDDLFIPLFLLPGGIAKVADRQADQAAHPTPSRPSVL
jgi:hypothetical protein